ncbi:uncharacterized protein LOC130998618 [Salvia miltiorrhiza]|uniref:uncharacterized protein LOC130998618 n=1 Tax=Salvia miltiorrhiza TaxID=226208 RepID=UPI0025ABCF72|nr:uncharacterized protein LOC130998618 [Salvia miltiorrhiza]
MDSVRDDMLLKTWRRDSKARLGQTSGAIDDTGANTFNNMIFVNYNMKRVYDMLGEFLTWIADVRDGLIGSYSDGVSVVRLPDDIVLKSGGDPLRTIISSTYSLFHSDNFDLSYLDNRKILAPTLDVVHSINEYMTNLRVGDGKLYFSSNCSCRYDSSSSLINDIHTPEFLNSLKCSGLPNHDMFLKVGTLILFLVNEDDEKFVLGFFCSWLFQILFLVNEDDEKIVLGFSVLG